MTCLANSSAFFKPELSASSTGTGPVGWRRWWSQQSIADGTDWISLITAAERVLRELRALHVVSS
jgi:hypothetical protein